MFFLVALLSVVLLVATLTPKPQTNRTSFEEDARQASAGLQLLAAQPTHRRMASQARFRSSAWHWKQCKTGMGLRRQALELGVLRTHWVAVTG